MNWIIILLLIGILLVMVEVFFVPGTTFVGIAGVFFAGIGIYLAYSEKGNTTGHIVLAITLTILLVSIIIAVKSGVWDKLSNKDILLGKSNYFEEDSIKIGEKGKAISALRPMGKARINDINYEVRTFGEYIESESKIEIIKIVGNQITVKQIEIEESNINPSED
ncbi:MAG: NfeD family protein [Bacteroidota bacterium]|nr:NfeD family protein [Bacteroidota bacterium]